jgi:hypothetical protein
MSKDDTIDQIPLFDVPPAKKEEPAKPVTPVAKPAPRRSQGEGEPARRPAAKKEPTPRTKETQVRGKPARGVVKVVKGVLSGQVPEGDVRLTANIREDLHLKLKIAAARRRTTIGELIEELVEEYL